MLHPYTAPTGSVTPSVSDALAHHPTTSIAASAKAFAAAHPFVLAFVGGTIIGVILVAGMCKGSKKA